MMGVCNIIHIQNLYTIHEIVTLHLTLFHLKAQFSTFTNRADPDQAALGKAGWLGSSLIAYGNMIRYDHALVN